jgi:hypothetical protein
MSDVDEAQTKTHDRVVLSESEVKGAHCSYHLLGRSRLNCTSHHTIPVRPSYEYCSQVFPASP